MGSSADAALVISPELVLVDPELARAIAELDKPTYSNLPEFTARSGGRSADAADEAERLAACVVKASRAELPRPRRIQIYALGMGLLVNAVLLGVLIAQSPQHLSSSAAQESAASSTQSKAPASTAYPAASGRSRTSTSTKSNAKRQARSDSELPSPAAQESAARIRHSRAPAATAPSAVLRRRGTSTGSSTEAQVSSGSEPARRPHPASRVVAERNVLTFLVRAAPVRQLLDPVTKLVRANVAVRCVPASSSGSGAVGRTTAFECQVWEQPGLPSSGVTVLYRVRARGGHSINVSRMPRT